MIYNNLAEFPSQEEIDRSIDYILEAGLTEREHSVPVFVPLHDLLFGVEDCIAISLVSYTAIMAIFSLMSSKGMPFIPLQFLLSPMLFVGLLWLSMWKDTMNRTIEWKQACRIDYRMITVHRMILFGGFSLVVNVVWNLLLWNGIGRTVSFLWILSFSFASLFLFGSMYLWTLNKRIPHGTVKLIVLWFLLSAGMMLYENIMTLTVTVPVSTLLAITIVSILGIVKQIRIFRFSGIKGDMLHA